MDYCWVVSPRYLWIVVSDRENISLMKKWKYFVILFCNKKNYCQPHYKSFIEKTIRGAFGLSGIPIEIEFRERTHVQDKFRPDGGLPGDVKDKMAKARKKAFRKSKKFRK